MKINSQLLKNGDLANRIKIFENESKKFEESQILTWSIQATTALRYLNVEKKIAHRDIKPGYNYFKFFINLKYFQNR